HQSRRGILNLRARGLGRGVASSDLGNRLRRGHAASSFDPRVRAWDANRHRRGARVPRAPRSAAGHPLAGGNQRAASGGGAALSGGARLSEAPSQRILAVDWLRGLAVLVMIQCHAMVLLLPELRATHTAAVLYRIDGLVAPSFILAAGFSL